MEASDAFCEQCSSPESIYDEHHGEIVEVSDEERSPRCFRSVMLCFTQMLTVPNLSNNLIYLLMRPQNKINVKFSDGNEWNQNVVNFKSELKFKFSVLKSGF